MAIRISILYHTQIMGKLLIILGPTSTGKTDLAINLAKKFNGELVSCDSRQVYKGVDIGTGKMPSAGRWKVEDRRWIVNGIPIHMYDVADPKDQYNVARFHKDANKIIKEILKRGKLPIIVGGTGLYLKALLEGLPNLAIPMDIKLRKNLSKLTKEQLQKKLKKISTEKWESLNYSDRQNPRRLIRAIELEISPRRSSFDFAQDHLRGGLTSYDILKIGLTAPRELLYQRIDERVLSRIHQGMLEETKKLQSNGLDVRRMKQLGLEYGVMAGYLSGKINRIELIKIMQGKIHGYVRRQLTWFKKEKAVIWFDITAKDFPVNVEKQVTKWYYQADESQD